MSSIATRTGQLAILVDSKLQVLKVLVRLSRRQVELIEAGEITTLIKLLAAKQTVMGQLQALERQLMPFRAEDPEKRVWSSLAQRAACQAQADLANSLLAEALEIEQRAETAMLARRESAAVELAAAQTASDARSAYAPPSALPIHSVQVEG